MLLDCCDNGYSIDDWAGLEDLYLRLKKAAVEEYNASEDLTDSDGEINPDAISPDDISPDGVYLDIKWP